jgi:hypothetical protein
VRSSAFAVLRLMTNGNPAGMRGYGTTAHVKVCGCPPLKVKRRTPAPASANLQRRKSRGRFGEAARQTLWGFGGCECEYNFCDMARTLRTGENAFRRSCNFKELRVVKRAHTANLCVMCLMAAFVPHRSNKYFHVMASNGIVSSSPYIS